MYTCNINYFRLYYKQYFFPFDFCHFWCSFGLYIAHFLSLIVVLSYYYVKWNLKFNNYGNFYETFVKFLTETSHVKHHTWNITRKVLKVSYTSIYGMWIISSVTVFSPILSGLFRGLLWGGGGGGGKIFFFIRDWPEIWKSEIPPSEFRPISGDWGKLGLPNVARISRINCNKILLNVAKCQGNSFYRFWVIKGKPTGMGEREVESKITFPHQIRVKALV